MQKEQENQSSNAFSNEDEAEDTVESENMKLKIKIEDLEIELKNEKQEKNDLHDLLKRARLALDAQADGIDLALDLSIRNDDTLY